MAKDSKKADRGLSTVSSKPGEEYVEDIEQAKDPRVGSASYGRNIYARIYNPLVGISKQTLFLNVANFCEVHGLEDKTSIFRKAALAAQSHDIENIEELSEDDRYHIRREATHRWHLPRKLYFTIALCSLGSAIQGWDNTGANGANLSYPEEFGIADNEWLIGVINSGPTLFGLLSAWAADPLNNWLGRRGTIFVTGLFCVFPVLAQAFTQNWWGLMLCRLFMGIGMGVKLSTIPVFSAEVSPASIRGGIVTSFQLWVAFGIFVGFGSNLIFYRIGRLAWRFQLAAAFVPAIPILIFVWLCPESPRWLMKKGRCKDAYASFCQLRNTELIAARELYYAHCQVMEEKNAFEGKALSTRAWEIATVPRLRRAMISSAIIVIGQQFSGVNIMAFYSSTIFSQAGYSVKVSLLASMGYGLVMFIFALPAVWTMDTFGRRNLLLFTFPNMAWCLLGAGLSFLLPFGHSARVPLIAFFIYLFTAFYGPGIGPIPSIYFSEAFPLSHRELGAAFTICINNAIGSALSLTFPPLLKALGPTGAFGFYAALNMLAFFVIFFIVPETKWVTLSEKSRPSTNGSRQRTLEELDYVFGVPTRRHVSYQAKTWLPYMIKRRVLFQKSARFTPLCQLETGGSNGREN
ncbi:hypothetical protein BBP40_011770 [Aspergillus hancockii]|nr:hypothetical protein BBP40_011770 [Aspergillus hancockii]